MKQKIIWMKNFSDGKIKINIDDKTENNLYYNNIFDGKKEKINETIIDIINYKISGKIEKIKDKDKINENILLTKYCEYPIIKEQLSYTFGIISPVIE